MRLNRRTREKLSSTPGRDLAPGQEEGFILLAVLFMLIIVLLTLSIAAPKMATSLRRDKEIETAHRGKEYARAIQLYYRQFGQYPNSIDQLVNTNNLRYLRRRYVDPMTGKDDWRIIHLGESRTMGMGLGGQIPGGTSPGAPLQPGIGGTGGSGGGSTDIFGSPTASSGTPGLSGGGSVDASGSSPFGGGSSSFGSSTGSASSSGSSASGTAGVSATGPGTPGAPGTGAGGTGTSSAFGTPGATTGAPIVGVGLPIAKSSIKILKKQDHYNLWEFVYDPTQDMSTALGQSAAAVPGQPGMGAGVPGAPGAPGIGGAPGTGTGGPSTGGFGSSSGGFGSSSGGFGSSGNSPTAPSNPPNNSPMNQSGSPF